MQITALVAAVLTLLYVVHSARVILHRRAARVSLGDGQDEELLRRIRIHGNFSEYVPLTLVLLLLLEHNIGNALIIWVFGLFLVLGRLLHAWGLWSARTPSWARVLGMALTFLVLLGVAVRLLWHVSF